ncbi:MAG TPA: 6-phosphogluconolactonase [Thermoanaerobaculia bacterium]|jgi:6-phosphogluconolactonase|nr:6-phosphogluconolactonase [Thermoanaerobaculia bacterium]
MTESTWQVRIVDDRTTLARGAAEIVAAAAESAVAARGTFSLVLSGGSTPRELYRLLADEREPYRARVAWERVHLWWGDERHVPPDHEESNFRMAREVLLAHAPPVPIPAANVHRIRAEDPDAARAAAEYDALLAPLASPRFDLVLLGLGADCHTASLFPGTEALAERRRLAVSVWVEKLSTHRITLTVPALSDAAQVLFLVAGEDKAAALARVLDGDEPPESCPARAVVPAVGELIWLVARDAAFLMHGKH